MSFCVVKRGIHIRLDTSLLIAIVFARHLTNGVHFWFLFGGETRKKFLDFGNSFARVEAFWACFGAVHDSVTTENRKWIP